MEQHLFSRMQEKVSQEYKDKHAALFKILNEPKTKFELSRKLLSGELAPEQFVINNTPNAKKIVAKAKPTKTTKPASTPAAPKKEATATPKEDAKGANSSYYFFKSTPKEEQAKFAPKKIEAPKPEEKKAISNGPSAWNKGGTWEEKDHSEWARTSVATYLGKVSFSIPEGTISLENWEVTGDCTVVFSRGKHRVGYELLAKTKYSGEYQGTKTNGTIEIPCLDDVDGDDCEINVSCKKSGAAHTVVKRNIQKNIDKLREQIAEFMECCSSGKVFDS